jgi:hypothetical protein
MERYELPFGKLTQFLPEGAFERHDSVVRGAREDEKRVFLLMTVDRRQQEILTLPRELL